MLKRLLVMIAALGLALVALAPVAHAQDGARIHLLHGIPDTDVDVAVGGEVAFPGFVFGDTLDLSDFAGQTLEGVQVLLAGTEDVAIDVGDLAVPASGNYTVIAHLDAEGAPTVSVFENDTSSLDAGNGRLTVRHTAAAPAVDVLANGEVAFSNLANGEEQAADLAAGTISAEVVPSGATEPVVIGPADLPVADGQSLIVYAVGSLDAGVDVLTETIDGLGSAPTAVETGTSPVSTQGDSSSGTLALVLAVGAAAAVVALGARRVAVARVGR
ncbi:MAG: DUF4397 domain-containing protein [Acidimicrobiales bacterium]|nr:DUF4397 domain-containing protein [Acidimicrobiales bacterium]